MSFIDKELGEIKLIANKRAKRIIIRYRNNRFELTHPDYLSPQEAINTLEKMRDSLYKLKRNNNSPILYTPDTILNTYNFDLNIKESTYSDFYISLKDGILNIVCPQNTDYKDIHVQSTIKNYIKSALYHEAKQILPNRISILAKEYNFEYKSVKINRSKGRWGSCSSSKNINLSYYCMLLPRYLVDFIILHELCHTIEMNHGENFWKLLNKVSGNKAKEFTADLKKYKTDL